jgi:hypothetical protein
MDEKESGDAIFKRKNIKIEKVYAKLLQVQISDLTTEKQTSTGVLKYLAAIRHTCALKV